MLQSVRSQRAGHNSVTERQQNVARRASQVAQWVKSLPANAGETGDLGSIPGQEDLLEEGTATYSSILAWRIPWTEEHGRSQRLGHN